MMFPSYPSPSKLPAQSPLILLAEDDDDFRGLLRFTLQRDGYRVNDVATGGALLSELQRGAHAGDIPALVISDDHMPGVAGITVFEETRRWGWGLPLLLITGFREREVIERANSADIKVLLKPFDLDDLRTVVQWYAPKRPRPGAPACVACGSNEDLRPMGALDDVMFCGECRDMCSDYDPTDPFIDLGGMG